MIKPLYTKKLELAFVWIQGAVVIFVLPEFVLFVDFTIVSVFLLTLKISISHKQGMQKQANKYLDNTLWLFEPQKSGYYKLINNCDIINLPCFFACKQGL